MRALLALLILGGIYPQATITKHASDREHDGFAGPVYSVSVVWSPIYMSHPSTPVGSRCRDMKSVYDKDGRLMKHSVYPGSCGSDEILEEYTYAKDGSRTANTRAIRGRNSPAPPPGIRLATSTPDDEGEPRRTFTYDPSGRLTEDVTVGPTGKVRYKSEYKYDSKGRLIEMDGSEADGQVSVRRVYSYEGDNRVPSGFIYYGRDGKVYDRTTYTNYEFNSRGDWVKRKETTEETFNRKTISWKLREIEYYPSN